MQPSIKVILLTLAATIVGTQLATAVPVPDRQGDYPIPKSARSSSPGQSNWIVVDGDSKGLNCRMAKQFQSVTLDGADAPAAIFLNNQYAIADWPIRFTFKKGQRLQAVTGNMGRNQIMLLDNRGKPWIPVSGQKGDRSINCFIRANSRFIKPLKEDSISGRAME
ncbi:hypothetical protein ACKFKH_18950 [Phormidesmis sp. 146-20]